MIHLNFHQNWWHRKKQNWKELLSPELVIFSSLKKSPISSNHQNFHQNWWHKKPNIGRNYCHQNWWHFCHSRTHQLLQFTKIFTKIGDKKKLKIGRNCCHQNWWHFCHSKTHQFLQLQNSAFQPSRGRLLYCKTLPSNLPEADCSIFTLSSSSVVVTFCHH